MLNTKPDRSSLRLAVYRSRAITSSDTMRHLPVQRPSRIHARKSVGQIQPPEQPADSGRRVLQAHWRDVLLDERAGQPRQQSAGGLLRVVAIAGDKQLSGNTRMESIIRLHR